jgi:hypothetical protein
MFDFQIPKLLVDVVQPTLVDSPADSLHCKLVNSNMIEI